MLGVWGAGFPYSQYATIGGGQHNSAYLMRFQGLTYSGEGQADSLIGERLFYCRVKMIGEHTEEDVGFNPMLELMKCERCQLFPHLSVNREILVQLREP